MKKITLSIIYLGLSLGLLISSHSNAFSLKGAGKGIGKFAAQKKINKEIKKETKRCRYASSKSLNVSGCNIRTIADKIATVAAVLEQERSTHVNIVINVSAPNAAIARRRAYKLRDILRSSTLRTAALSRKWGWNRVYYKKGKNNVSVHVEVR